MKLPVDPNAYYWHFKCPSCAMPVVRADTIALTKDVAQVLKTIPPVTLRCTSCGATMTGYLQKPKLGQSAAGSR